MWIDKKYENRNWNPAIGQTFKINGNAYEMLMWGKSKGVAVWSFVNWKIKKEYELTEPELYAKLKQHGII